MDVRHSGMFLAREGSFLIVLKLHSVFKPPFPDMLRNIALSYYNALYIAPKSGENKQSKHEPLNRLDMI